MTEPIAAIMGSMKSPSAGLTQPTAVQDVAPVKRQYDGVDAERFSRLMEAPSASTPTPQIAPTKSVSSADGLGDKVLARMSTMGDEFKKTWEQVADVVAGPDNSLSMQDMLKAQMHLVKVATEYEMIGKAIGKSTQNVDQMIRMQ